MGGSTHHGGRLLALDVVATAGEHGDATRGIAMRAKGGGKCDDILEPSERQMRGVIGYNELGDDGDWWVDN